MSLSDTSYLILDWKSGKEDVLQNNISNQLRVYALKMLLKKGLTSLEGMHIEAYEIYLKNMNAYGGVLTQNDITTIITKI
ncbi:MAG: hypothetical protein LBP53_05490 [Candidatus Peribacteria bacterium]|nr:hypothetical protein [Candidatus Peribacteria bacterium]